MTEKAELNLNLLPDLVLIEIFKFLAPKDRLKVTLVCKKFNEIVSKTPNLLEDITIKIPLKCKSQQNANKVNAVMGYFRKRKERKSENYEVLFETGRIYRNLRVVGQDCSPHTLINRPLLNEENSPNLRKLIKSIGQKFKTFEIINCNLDADFIGTILTFLPDLETFNISKADNIVMGSNSVKIQLPKLKSLNLFIQCFSDPLGNMLDNVSTLETVTLKTSLIGNRRSLSNFMTGLAKQTNLKTMKIHRDFFELFFNPEFLQQIQFDLREFEVRDGHPKFFKIFGDFLETQKSLEVVKFGRREKSELNEQDFESLKRLMGLVLRQENLRDFNPPYFYNPIDYDVGSKKLERLDYEMARNSGNYVENLERLGITIPNLKKLTITTNFTNDTVDLNFSALNRLQNLKTLKIFGVHHSLMRLLNLEKLRKFEVSFIRTGHEKYIPDPIFLDFMKIHKKLRKIVFHQAIFSKKVWSFIEVHLRDLEMMKFSYLDCRDSGFDREIEDLIQFIASGGKYWVDKKGYGGNSKYGVYCIRKLRID
jgi:hypothetical protein